MSQPVRRLHVPATAAGAPAAAGELGGLEAVSAAVESGAGLPEVVRAAARALDASLMLRDRRGAVLAVAASSPADERSLSPAFAATGSRAAKDGSSSLEIADIELRVADSIVGTLRMRARSGEPTAGMLSLIKALIASEVERVQAPERASQQASASFMTAVLEHKFSNRDQLLAHAAELGLSLESGGSVVLAYAQPLAATDDDWRGRVLAVAERGARAALASTLVAPAQRPDARAGEVVVLVADPNEAACRRVADVVMRELEASLQGFAFTVGRSRVALDPLDLHRAGNEALLAANVAVAKGASSVLGFDEIGVYRLLLSTMSENPDELQRFYADTVEPLIAYDEQYETDLVQTLETFLDCDGNVAQSAQRLFTHRHTIRYRLERVRELSGLDVGSSDGREKLSLGLKSMRVLGISTPQGPATEAGAEGGRVPRPPDNR